MDALLMLIVLSTVSLKGKNQSRLLQETSLTLPREFSGEFRSLYHRSFRQIVILFFSVVGLTGNFNQLYSSKMKNKRADKHVTGRVQSLLDFKSLTILITRTGCPQINSFSFYSFPQIWMPAAQLPVFDYLLRMLFRLFDTLYQWHRRRAGYATQETGGKFYEICYIIGQKGRPMHILLKNFQGL